jgi:hypothetical protein
MNRRPSPPPHEWPNLQPLEALAHLRQVLDCASPLALFRCARKRHRTAALQDAVALSFPMNLTRRHFLQAGSAASLGALAVGCDKVEICRAARRSLRRARR